MAKGYRGGVDPASVPVSVSLPNLGLQICTAPCKRVDCTPVAGTRGNRASHKENTTELFMKSGIDTATFAILHHKRIYFGHQSVGANILAGIQDMGRTDPAFALNIVESCKPDAYNEPVLGHSRIGRNHDPRSKIDGFSEVLGAGLGNRVDMALFKFCYVDVTDGSDYTGLFDYYRNVMKQLARAYPHTQLIHVTLPVTVMPGLLRRIVGNLRRRPNRAAHDNLARAEFNRLLIQTYAEIAPVFDLAGVESTTASGRAVRYALRGREFRTLVPSYSSDGRHLSETGRRVVASKFLHFLAKTAVNQSTSSAHAGMAHV